MNEKLKTRLELFAQNTQSIKKDFIWQNTLIKRLAALLYAVENKTVDCGLIHDCHDLIKKNTGIFSTFRGNLAICIATLLSLSDDRDRQFSNTLAVYDMMKDLKFRASDYLVVAAYQIASNTDVLKYRQTIDRAKAFYDGMKSKHWFYTGQDDYIFAAMLGLSDIDINIGIDRMEKLHQRLKPELHFGNSIQALTQVMVLGGGAGEEVAHILRLHEAFRSRKIRLDRENTLSSLGILSLLPVDVALIVDDVSESYDYLRMQRGFGAWSITKQELLLLSAAIVSYMYVDDVKSGVLTTTISTSITNIIIAQQTAIAVAAASSAAVASSSSN